MCTFHWNNLKTELAYRGGSCLNFVAGIVSLTL